MNGTTRNILVNTALVVCFILTLIVYASFRENADQTAYEIPKILSSQPEKIVRHTGYTVSFNTDWKIPNWVAYELTSEEVAGTEPRGNNFVPDPQIWQSPSTEDYKNSGYDRGHMAPAADMKWSKKAMDESFYTSNICPQNKNLNKGDWKDLEELARAIAAQYGSLYICCGPIVTNTSNTIGINKIVIPQSFYKVFLRKKTDGAWTSIGFVMPNKAGNKPLMTYMHSIDEVEHLSGIDFFFNLPDSIEEVIEADYATSDWTIK